MENDDGIWNYCNNSAVRRTARRLGQFYDDFIGPSGLKGTQFSLMTQIVHSGEPSLKSLADALIMDLSALGHTLKPLVRDGLVELVADDKDRRVKRARLTALGAERQADARALWQEAQGRLDAAYGADNSAQLRAALNTIASMDLTAATRDENK
ncbi:MarR family winged helix-turn-helix transcriptional regulator [Rhizobium sp. 18065]|uniref:MarR family winged helix-turn-helix transcriptional regulator n=1 Tax=Rhizobium sp. 18065 TaxID=2681411 RepID=UPI00135B31D0|nr:MarR family winged helix-turn-helix transcriptional regulator [Rhizobium sp. 18065]